MTPEQIAELTKKLTDEGLIIAVGWKGFELGVIDPRAGEMQRQDMRLAFYAGAAHLYASLMSGLEEGQEPTVNDLQRMANIHAELERFGQEFALRAAKAGGRG